MLGDEIRNENLTRLKGIKLYKVILFGSFVYGSPDIARFAGQLQEELDGLGSYFPETNSK